MQSGPTQTAEWGVAAAWRARPWASRIVRACVFLTPVVVSFAVARAIARYASAESLGVPTLAWWVAVSGIAMATLVVVDRFARRFLPLATLLQLSLVFPDQAPSRFKRALRSGTTNQLGKELDHYRRHGQLSDKTTYGDYLLELANALTRHDRLTRGHSERVRAYADLIAEELGLPEPDRQKLHWAALLHDVGKLDVPSNILNKAGRPNEYEWMVLKGHPGAARLYLEPLRPWLGEWLHAADEHHLRWDGNGYPAKTAGTDISLAGRIVAVADAYDVMTSARSYKKAMPAADARAEIANCAGSQFDPAVARAFLNIGLSKLKLSAGSIGWLGHTFGLETVGVGTVAAPAATTASVATQAAVATMTVVGSMNPAVLDSRPPEFLAFTDQTTTTIVVETTTPSDPILADVELVGIGDSSTTVPEIEAVPAAGSSVAPSTVAPPAVANAEAAQLVVPPASTTTVVAPAITTSTQTLTTRVPTTTTQLMALGSAPEFVDVDAVFVAYGTRDVQIPVDFDDVDDDLVEVAVIGLPDGLEFTGTRIVGTVQPHHVDQVHQLLLVATDAAGNETQVPMPLRTVQFERSPLFGTIVVSEVLYHDNNEFIELASIEQTPIDIGGFTIRTDSPLEAQQDSVQMTVPIGTIIDQFGPVERAVLWVDEIERDQEDVPAYEWQLGIGKRLNNTGDDVFVLDADGRLVAYVAWGTGGTVSTLPTLNEGTAWIGWKQSDLAGAGRGRSISLASHQGRIFSSTCWEHTNSGDAQGRTCIRARVTRDIDDSRTNRKTNVGRMEW